MKRILWIIALSFLTTFYGYSVPQGTSHRSGGTSHSSSSGRPQYSGTKHTESHGGNYSGQTNSQSHKGGQYTAPNGYKGYGTHSGK